MKNSKGGSNSFAELLELIRSYIAIIATLLLFAVSTTGCSTQKTGVCSEAHGMYNKHLCNAAHEAGGDR